MQCSVIAQSLRGLSFLSPDATVHNRMEMDGRSTTHEFTDGRNISRSRVPAAIEETGVSPIDTLVEEGQHSANHAVYSDLSETTIQSRIISCIKHFFAPHCVHHRRVA